MNKQRTPEQAELDFYLAFVERDIQIMERVWANQEVICIHPGSTALQGRNAVLQSWSEIFAGTFRPSIRVQPISRIQHADLSIHVVEEHITTGGGDEESASIVLATNIFQRIEGAWYMLEHHASLPLVSSELKRLASPLH